MKKLIGTLSAVLCSLIIFCASSNSQAAPILDQVNDHIESFYMVYSPYLWVGQTFEVGETGLLTGLDLYLRRYSDTTDNLLIEIVNVDDNPLTEQLSNTGQFGVNLTNASPRLASVSLTSDLVSSSNPGKSVAVESFWTHIDLTSFGVDVETGDNLAILLSTDADINNGDSYLWGHSGYLTDSYIDGILINKYGRNGNFWTYSPGYTGDNMFRTYVDTDFAAPVPEPSTILLLGSGLLGLGWYGRKRKKA